MALADVRPYFRDKMDALDFNEHTDAFNFDNIAQSNLDRAYHLEAGATAGIQLDHGGTSIEMEVIVRFFIRGYNDPIEAVDSAIVEGEAIINSILQPTDRLVETFKNVLFNSMEFEPQNTESNDNDVKGTLTFTISDVICF